MAGGERVSRREVLKSGAALRGGLGVGVSVAAALRTEQSSTRAWVLKPDESEIAGSRGVIERSVGSMMSLCTVGQEYHGRTCDGQQIQLLVLGNEPQPTVDDTYRFESSGRKNSCDETLVELSPASPCQRATEDDPGSESSASSDSTTTDSGSASTDETDSEPSPPDSTTESTPTTTDSDPDTTTESTTTTDAEDDSTPTTTESTPTSSEADSDSPPATPESNSDDSGSKSDATESSPDASAPNSDASESEGEDESRKTTTAEFDS